MPDAKNDVRLQHYIRVLEVLVEQSLKPTRKEIQAISAFMPIFEKRVDGVILDLKKRSFALQQHISDGGDDTTEEVASTPCPQVATQSVPRSKVATQDSDAESSADDDETDGGVQGYASNDVAYKSVDIDENLLREELAYLRGLVWKILETVHSQYDFGIVQLDCTRFKDSIVSHVQELIKHIEVHLQGEFLTQQRGVQGEIAAVEGQLGHTAESIDEVIVLLDYIESLKRQDNKVEDIAQLIGGLAGKMRFVESVNIMFDPEHYEAFLAMRNWPRTFMEYIEQRKSELLDQKEDLYTLMRREIEEVFSKVTEFRAAIADAVE